MSGGLSALFHDDRDVSVVSVVPPQDGGWSLTPMENLLLGVRNEKHNIALEIQGVDGVVSYQVRTSSPESIAGMFNSYFSQSRISVRHRGSVADPDPTDWLHLAEDEQAFVQTLHLSKEPFLPLRIFDDNRIRESAVDPLAGVIGLLSSSTYSSGHAGSDRMGIRLLVRPAPENWGASYQSRMQKRRDGDDRAKQVSSSPSDSGPPTAMLVLAGLLGGIGLGNFYLWDTGQGNMLLPFNMASAVLGGGVVWAMRRMAGNKTREYLDEELIEKKLKSLAFYSELQVVRIFRHPADEHVAQASVDNMLHCLSSFDDPAGNAWKPGKLRRYSGQEVLREDVPHPFRSGSQEMDWLESGASKRAILSAREAASVWHPPLGAEEMASMERVASTTLIPYLSDLVGLSEDSGPLVGVAGKGIEIRLPESAIRKHTMVLGKSGSGKSTLIKHVIGHKLERKAAGLDDSAVVVIDPHSDLVTDILTVVPPEIAHKVRLVDFGREDRVPGLNLLDPQLFPDRDRCVDTIVTTVKHLWDTWGGRLEDLLRRSLSAIYEYNAHPDTPRHEMMTMLDVLKLLSDGDQVGSGRDVRTVLTSYQRSVLARCVDPRITEWFETYIKWPNDTRAEAVGPVFSRVGYYANNARASVVMGLRESTLTLDSVLSEGQVLLVATASGSIGQGPAALMGGTVISLVESAIRDQERLAAKDRKKCLLVCDEFQTVTGANWEGMFAEIRKYGCSMMLATQSLARLDTGERKLRSGIMGNVGCIVAHQMAAEDAQLIAPELDADRVSVSDIVNIDPRNCIVRINTDTKCYPAFSMSTLPPPDAVRGSDEAAEIVIRSSEQYTVDFEATRQAMMAEVSESLAQGKKGSDSDSPFSGAAKESSARDDRNRAGAGPQPRGERSPSAGGDAPGSDAPDRLSEIMGMLNERRARDGRSAEALPEGESGSAPLESPLPEGMVRPPLSPPSLAPDHAGSVAAPGSAGDGGVAGSEGGPVAPGARQAVDPDPVSAGPPPAGERSRGDGPRRRSDPEPVDDFPPDAVSSRERPSLEREAPGEPLAAGSPVAGPDSSSAVGEPAAGGAPDASAGDASAADAALGFSPSGRRGTSREARDLSNSLRAVSKEALPDRPRSRTKTSPTGGGEYSPVGVDLTGVRRWGSGPLRDVPASDIENSDYSVEFLEDVVRNANRDPGLRRALDKRRGDQIDHDRKLNLEAMREEGRREAREEMSEVLSAQEAEFQREMAVQVARAREEAMADALAKARVEVGLQAQSEAASRERAPVSPDRVSAPGAAVRPVPRAASAADSYGYDSLAIDDDDITDLLGDPSGTDGVPLAVPVSGAGDEADEVPSSLRRPAVSRRRS